MLVLRITRGYVDPRLLTIISGVRGQDCTYEGHMISTIPAITNPLNGLKAPMQVLLLYERQQGGRKRGSLGGRERRSEGAREPGRDGGGERARDSTCNPNARR